MTGTLFFINEKIVSFNDIWMRKILQNSILLLQFFESFRILIPDHFHCIVLICILLYTLIDYGLRTLTNFSHLDKKFIKAILNIYIIQDGDRRTNSYL
jgi:hypothetical protein